MERTTVRLDPALLRDAKRLALDTDRTLTAVISDALREAVARGRRSRTASREKPLPVSKCRGGLLPGVSLDSYAQLLDRLDGFDADA